MDKNMVFGGVQDTGQLWKTSLGKCLKSGTVVLNTAPKTDHRQLATGINVQLRRRVKVKVHILPFKWIIKTGKVVACKTVCFKLYHIKYIFLDEVSPLTTDYEEFRGLLEIPLFHSVSFL